MTSPLSRNDPRLVLVRAVQAAVSFVPFVVVWGSLQERSGWSGPWPVVVLWVVGLSRLHSVVWEWSTTRYCATPDGISVVTGLVATRRSQVDWDDVVSVQVTRPWLHQLLGCASVEIGLGAAGKQALTLAAVSGPEAARITRLSGRTPPTGAPAAAAAHPSDSPQTAGTSPVHGEQVGAGHVGAGHVGAGQVDAAPAPAELVHAMGPLDHLVVSITHGQFALFLPACAAALSEVSRWVALPGAGALPAVSRASAPTLVLAVLAVVVAALGYGYLVASVRYRDFRVHLRGGTLTMTGGLLTQQSRVVELARVDGLVVEQNPLMRLTGYGRLRVVSRQTGSRTRSNVVFPAVTLPRMAAGVEQHFPAFVGVLEPPRGQGRGVAVGLVSAVATVCALTWLLLDARDVPARALVLAAVVPALVVVSDRLWTGLELLPDRRAFRHRRGLLCTRTYQLPLRSVHVVTCTRGPLSRRVGRAGLSLLVHDGRRTRLRLRWCTDDLPERVHRLLLGPVRAGGSPRAADPAEVPEVHRDAGDRGRRLEDGARGAVVADHRQSCRRPREHAAGDVGHVVAQPRER